MPELRPETMAQFRHIRALLGETDDCVKLCKLSDEESVRNLIRQLAFALGSKAGEEMRPVSLTWEELAELYHKRTGGQARVKPMNTIFAWAKKQPDIESDGEDGLRMKTLEPPANDRKSDSEAGP